MNGNEIVAAIRLAMNCIEDAARAAGPAGAPSGIIFAGLQASGMRLEPYQQILAAMVKAGSITIDKYHLIRIPEQEPTP